MLQLQMTSAQLRGTCFHLNSIPPNSESIFSLKNIFPSPCTSTCSIRKHCNVPLPNGALVSPLALLNLNFWLNLAFMTPLRHRGCDYCNKCGDAWFFDFKHVWWMNSKGKIEKKSILSSSKPGLNGR